MSVRPLHSQAAPAPSITSLSKTAHASALAAAAAAAAAAPSTARLPSTTAPSALHSGGWRSLGTPAEELRLELTLPTGQSFRWRQTSPIEYTGVLGSRLVRLRQEEEDVLYCVLARAVGASPAGDHAAVADYFNLSLQPSLAEMTAVWATKDPRFAQIAPHFRGCRMLRQDPVECLFQFICSSNNHISRIHGMVERLCRANGTPIPHDPALDPPSPPAAAIDASAAGDSPLGEAELQPRTPSPHQKGNEPDLPAGQQMPPRKRARGAAGRKEAGGEAREAGADGAVARATVAADAVPGMEFYTFPTLEQLAEATEEELRGAGFGYRAKFIVGSVAALRAKPGGGEAWLHSLRSVPYPEASAALCTLPGIGPKVAGCIALFSLDKHDAIPVDTHVWQLAVRYYTPHLAGKTLTKRVHEEVEAAFVTRFGGYAGWAHNTLFISELASQRDRLPPRLWPAAVAAAERKASAGRAKGAKGKKKSSGDLPTAAMPASEQEAAVSPDAPCDLEPEQRRPPRQRRRAAGSLALETDVAAVVVAAVRESTVVVKA